MGAPSREGRRVNIADFVHELTWCDLPDPIRGQARRCLLDTIGAGLAGRRTELSRIVHEGAAAIYGGDGARLWLDGRAVSPAGAALANGMTIDAFDIHDGYTLVKGHAGAAIVPAVLAMVCGDGATVSGEELLTTVVVGYEVALRAGVALHGTVCDYHTSGAWNALGCAATTARRLGLDAERTRHALGIAEYHGPRSQMMRCIDHPTMVKDGSGWGAMAGVSAALLAARGFTGAPAVTVEAPEVAAIWADLGERWLMAEQYFKPYAVCRWAQPAIAGALAVQQSRTLPLDAIARIEVRTFHEATRLASRRPATTEEAQYSLPFPVAAALVHGQLGLDQLTGQGLTDPLTLRLADRVCLIDEPAFDARFPAERVARVRIELANGTELDSGDVQARWDGSAPPSDDELREKFRWLAGESVSEERATAIRDLVWNCAEFDDAGRLVDLLAAPADR
jgi:2-methylcitrate dehydratase PrpD